MVGGKIGIPELVVALFILIVFLVIWYRIYSKSGHSGWLCLLMMIPLVNLITILWFAFSTWPVEKELARLRGVPPAAQM